ncbi:MAG TPA: hypothetical protein VGH50_10650 [Candidatus Binatia bacterium]|jgi:hypothetical protein
MRRGFETKVVAVLAVAQAAFGVLRAMGWFQIGSDLFGKGLLLLPVIGMVAFARGALVAAIAALYVLFAFGLWNGRSWARGVGWTAAVLNLLLAASALIQGEFIVRLLLSMIVPLIVVWHLLTPRGELSGGGRAVENRAAS